MICALPLNTNLIILLLCWWEECTWVRLKQHRRQTRDRNAWIDGVDVPVNLWFAWMPVNRWLPRRRQLFAVDDCVVCRGEFSSFIVVSTCVPKFENPLVS